MRIALFSTDSSITWQVKVLNASQKAIPVGIFPRETRQFVDKALDRKKIGTVAGGAQHRGWHRHFQQLEIDFDVWNFVMRFERAFQAAWIEIGLYRGRIYILEDRRRDDPVMQCAQLAKFVDRGTQLVRDGGPVEIMLQ